MALLGNEAGITPTDSPEEPQISAVSLTGLSWQLAYDDGLWLMTSFREWVEMGDSAAIAEPGWDTHALARLDPEGAIQSFETLPRLMALHPIAGALAVVEGSGGPVDLGDTYTTYVQGGTADPAGYVGVLDWSEGVNRLPETAEHLPEWSPPDDSPGFNDVTRGLDGKLYVHLVDGTAWRHEDGRYVAAKFDEALADSPLPEPVLDAIAGLTPGQFWFDGRTLVIGAPDASGERMGSGAAVIHTWDGDGLTMVQRLTASDALPYQSFGNPVCVEGICYDTGPPEGKGFGRRVHLAGDVLVISNEAQQFYRFTRDAVGTWTEREVVNLPGDPIVLGDRILLIDANENRGQTRSAGAAYLLDYDGSTWTPTKRIVPKTRWEDARFGDSWALTEDSVLIAAPRHRRRLGRYTEQRNPPVGAIFEIPLRTCD